MNNLCNQSSRKVYNLNDTPWYFGAYLNMARHNIYLISNEISDKLSLNRPITDEECIADSFLKKKEFWDKNNPRLILSALSRFMPAVKIYSSDLLHKELREQTDVEGTDIAGLTEFLKLSFIELNAFRNDYSHYYSSKTYDKRKVVVAEDFAIMLRNQFQSAVSIARKRFEGVIPSKSFDFVEKKIAEELFNDSTTITTRGLVFFTCLFLDKENAFQFFNKVSGFKNTRTYDFLATREVFTVFCVKLPHDKFVSENPQQALQLDILNYLNRAPKELYNSLTKEGKKIFQPDLSEFAKNNIAKNSTNETIAEYDYDEYIQAITTKTRSEDRFPEFALRYLDQSDAFQYHFHIHLGKVITNKYPKPFLGESPDEDNRNIEKSIKTFGELTAFLKPHETDTEGVKNSIIQEAAFKKLFQEQGSASFTQYAPQYHIQNNKIGLLCKQNKKFFNNFYRPLPPDAFLSMHELPKVALLEILDKGKASELIKEFLQKNEKLIYNRDFIEEIKQQLNFKPLQKLFFDEKSPKLVNNKETERKIEETQNQNNQSTYVKDKEKLRSEKKALKYAQYVNEVNARKEHLNKVLEKYQLDTNQIPSRIIEYWLNIDSVKKEHSIKNRIKAERKECKNRIKELDKGNAPKIGEMATFLARDIVNLVINKDVKKKITSFYYNLLQECLALYADPAKRQLLLDLCGKKLNLFNKDIGHPFLADINFGEITKTKDLYRKYLELKGAGKKIEKKYDKKTNQFKEIKKEDNWIYDTFYLVTKDPKTNKDITEIKLPESKVPLSYLRLNQNKSDFDFWLNSVSKGNNKNPNPKPVDLPTNLFDEALISLLKEKVKINDDTKYNYSKLLALWLKETQPYYHLKREYTIFKDKPYQTIVEFDNNENKPFKEYYANSVEQAYRKRKREEKRIQKRQIATLFKKAIEDNEKVIRFYQTKDRITLLMLNKLMGKDLQLSLNELSPDSDKSPLEKPITISEKIHGKTITDTRKRKDFSVFRKLISDRRLKHLFDYYSSETIPYEVLREELNDYDRCKEKVFKAAFDLEKAIIDTVSKKEEYKEDYKDIIGSNKNNKKESFNIQHRPYLDFLCKYSMINCKERKFLENVRNRFSHNQYPSKDAVAEFIPEFANSTIASKIVDTYVEIIDRLITTILR